MTDKPGPCHIHEPKDDGFPQSYPNGWEPNFLVEFGEEGTDYGGFMVSGFRGYGPEYHPEIWKRLIAAAPALLEAAKAAECLLGTVPEMPNYEGMGGSVRLQLQVAIAQAEKTP